MSDSYESFKEKLDDSYRWPSLYTFKFVVPAKSREALLKVIPSNSEVSERSSRTGKYSSITIRKVMSDSDAVIAAYKNASTVQGVISL